ncbi:MAG: thioredoxin family protein [Bacteroidales bacterium]|nr:thioredoxin family protein [Bacteroidales bacterium]
MKLKNLLLIVLVFAFFSSYSQIRNRVVEDVNVYQNVLIGECTKSGLIFEDFGLHMKYEYDNYQPDTNTINKVAKKIDGLKITIVLGTWCKDSKKQVPRFLKILDKLKFNEKDITIIGVNSKMHAFVMSIDQYKIEKVPTFIFYRKGKEVGRITETPKKTLEKDMLKQMK